MFFFFTNALFHKICKQICKQKPVKKARAYVAGIGYNEFEINGQRVGSSVLDPATSDFSKTIYYSTYDIKELLNKENVMVTGVLEKIPESSSLTFDFLLSYDIWFKKMTGQRNGTTTDQDVM